MNRQQKILTILNNINRTTEVCTSGDMPMILPGLTVNGVGGISFPLDKTQAQQLIKQSHHAPYGKGVETLVDTEVRKTWELNTNEFKLTNPAWQRVIDETLIQVQQKLGLEHHQLKAHPYKLLTYETGDFFRPHRDGEKLDNMVATLVITLPSVYEGGEFIVYHEGEQYEMRFEGARSGYQLSYSAFYADCEHEIKPLKSGYRLCLTYNVTLVTASAKKGMGAPSWQSTINDISGLLQERDHKESSPKTAILLDHHYTQDGLFFDKLKGLDQTKATILFDAAKQADYIAHLALVTLWQSGAAEDDGNYGYNRYYDDDDGDHEMGEIFDESLSINHWSNYDSKKVNFGKMTLDQSEVVAETALLDGDPDKEEFEGYTGNAGMTLDRWYHRAAIVTWSRQDHFEMLCESGTEAAIAGLNLLVAERNDLKPSEYQQQHQDCLRFATTIIATWKPPHSNYGHRGNNKRNSQRDFVRLLRQLDDPELVRCLLSELMVKDASIQLNRRFCQWLTQQGLDNFTLEFQSIISAMTIETANRNATLLALLCSQDDKNSERITLCKTLVDDAIKGVKKLDQAPPTNRMSWEDSSMKRPELLSALVKAMLTIDAEQSLLIWIEHTLKYETKYELIETQLIALFSLQMEVIESSSPAISVWLAHCRQQLEKRTTNVPKKPTDYQRQAELSCHCADCQMLSAFLADPHRAKGRFPLAKKRRQHLHQMIGRHQCDTTHVTERVGRPFRLVCTKTTASYDLVEKTYRRDLHYLSRIIVLQQKRE